MKQNIKAFWTLLQREVWQNYKTWLLWTLGIYASIVLLGITLDRSLMAKNSITFLGGLLEVIVLVAPFILNILLLGYLYYFVSKDHEHNNLSFWRSLPPDDGFALAAKLFTALITLPMLLTIFISLLWIIAAVLGGALVLIANLSASDQNLSTFFEFMKMLLNPSETKFPSLFTFLSKDLLLYWPIRALWLAPLVCLFMLAQTIFKRNGSILVIAAFSSLSALEFNYLDSFYINSFVVEHVRYGAQSSSIKGTQSSIDYMYENFKLRHEPESKRQAVKDAAEASWFSASERYVSKLHNWSFSVGLLLSALFFSLSVWIRKRRAKF
jgi:hypothetical protein